MRTLKIPPFLLKSRDFRIKNVLLSNNFDDPDFFMEEEREAKSLSLKLFKRLLDREDYAVICGCDSTDSEITIGVVDQEKLYLMFQDHMLQCVGECLIYQDASSRLSLFNEHVRFLNQERIKLRKYQWFSRQKKACENFGITAIHVAAVRSAISQGYRRYPLMGFDAELSETFRRLCPDQWNLYSLHDLLEQPEMWDFWVSQGTDINMTFEIRAGSRSQKIFENYCV